MHCRFGVPTCTYGSVAEHKIKWGGGGGNSFIFPLCLVHFDRRIWEPINQVIIAPIIFIENEKKCNVCPRLNNFGTKSMFEYVIQCRHLSPALNAWATRP